MKRVLMLNYEFPPLGGGAGNATYCLLKELAKREDVKIDLVTSSSEKYRNGIFAKNINVHYLDIGKNNKDLQWQSVKDLVFFTIKAVNYCKQLVKKNNYNCAHAFFGVPSGYVARNIGLPYIVSLRGSDVPGHNKKYNFLHRIISSQLKKIYQDARHVVANSIDLKLEAEKFLPMQYKVIENGVDSSLFFPADKQASVFKILFVGRLNKIKNISLLVKSFAIFKQRVAENVELVLVGDGPEVGVLSKLCEDLNICKSVSFKGFVPRERLSAEYGQSDVFVLLSEKEGMSNTLLEAMASGLPIVATDTGDTKKLVSANGFIVTRNAKEVADRLFYLYTHKEEREKMGFLSREKASQMGWGVCAQKYADLYFTL